MTIKEKGPAGDWESWVQTLIPSLSYAGTEWRFRTGCCKFPFSSVFPCTIGTHCCGKGPRAIPMAELAVPVRESALVSSCRPPPPWWFREWRRCYKGQVPQLSLQLLGAGCQWEGPNFLPAPSELLTQQRCLRLPYCSPPLPGTKAAAIWLVHQLFKPRDPSLVLMAFNTKTLP